MKIKSGSLPFFIALLGLILSGIKANAQEYVSPTKPSQIGRSPGVKVKLISQNGPTRTYVLVFAKGDEIMSGLNEFVQKYKVQSAHFTAIGDATSAKIGWYDKTNKMFKVNHVDEQSEITSLIGDVALSNGKPVVHAHINLAAADGSVRGGHLLEAFVAPTLEVMITVEPVPLYKKPDTEFGISVIDPAQ
jgi:predicted DNA-binding protein with PD1-like motif